ncbi:D-alanyl-D-alanine carboxypeptidase family protein [Bacillus sp. SG-1]|uniref:D-alanyl-D-alanine carboxypeptidase family protein n=1 Tax=Bacillus sp. SG-1 TaxID=161544 RepID=UPI000154370A|nr:D-alanyl-D-alanine carboxypeptidase family protein [Bacillus sp. SG-1]EDL64815.1 D-alanyl-D-alanine carboxypeptidase (penicillin-binding protein) [Bacillus sp. SG-1]
MKKRRIRAYIYTVFIFSVIFSSLSGTAEAAPSVSAQRAIVIDQDTGRVLYEKDAHTPSRIASITKIMTAILAIESGKLEETVKVSNNAVKAEGSSIYLKPGEKIKLEDLVYGLMLRSGNDSAVAIAEHVGGSLDGFIFLMNKKAEEIGMRNTHFANPHGLDDHEDHYSTAFDMALLTKYAMQNEKYKEVAGTKVHTSPDPEHDWDRKWKNKNRLLTELYKYCTGGKTGYTKRAKRTLVTTATKGEQNLIAVTLNGPDDWNDHIQMFEFGFKNFDTVIAVPEGNVKKIEDEFYKNKVYIKRDVLLTLTKEEEESVRVEYKLMKPEDSWRDGAVPDVVGKAVIYMNEKEADAVPLFYSQEKVTKKKSWWMFWKQSFISVLGVKTDG